MPDTNFTLIDGGSTYELVAQVEGDGVRIAPESLESALGWTLQPEGLCRGELCLRARDPAALADERGIDLAAFAELQGRPLALDPEERAGALGTSAAERGSQLATLTAPDFTLPDLEGRSHSLSQQRGKKVLLIAYASW
jgi:hypothetical protein